MARSGEIRSQWTLDNTAYLKSLQDGLQRTQVVAEQIKRSFGAATMPATSAPTAARTRVDPAVIEQRKQVRLLRDELSRLQLEYERDRNRKKFLADTSSLAERMVAFRKTLSPTAAEVGVLDRALGQLTRNVNTVEGRLSGLGISQQIVVGLNQRLAGSFAATTGPIGDAALGIAAMNGGLGAVTTGAALAGGAILGLGVGTAALVQRGKPQLEAYTNAINVLAASGEDISNIGVQLRELQREGGRTTQAFSRAELATALAETVKAGVSLSDALVLLRTSSQLASAENQNLADSTGLVLKVIRQFRLDTEDAGRVGNVLAAGAQLAAGSAQDLALGLADVAPIARAAGLTLEETTGLLISLDNQGLSAANVGANGLRSALAALSKPSKEAEEDLTALGVSLTNADGTTKSVRDRLFEVRDAILASGKDLTEFSNIADTYALTALLALDKSADDFIDTLVTSDGALSKYAVQLAQGVPAAQVRANKAIDDLALTFSEKLAPAIEKSANFTTDLIRNLDDLGSKPIPSVDTAENFLFGASAADEILTARRDLEDAQSKLDELVQRRDEILKKAPQETNAGQNLFSRLLTVTQADIDAQLASVDEDIARRQAILDSFEARLEELEARYLNAGGGGASGGRQKRQPVDIVITPTVTVDQAAIDAAEAEFQTALSGALDAAKAAEIASMQDGEAKVARQRDAELEAARRAFEERTATLTDGSTQYNAVKAAYDRETVAIEQRANTQLSDLADARLETQRNLNEGIRRAQDTLAQEQAANDPLRLISLQFRQANRQIKSDTDALLREAESAYSDGAITYEQYQARVTEIGKLGAARQVQAEKDKTTAIREEFERRQGILEDAQGRLEQAQVDGIVGTLPQLEAKFAQERAARRKDFEGQLSELKGTAQERARLIQTFNATEAQYARIHQQELNRASSEGLTAYREQVEAANRQLLQARQEAQDRELALERDFQTARANAAQQRLSNAGQATDDSTNVRSLQREASAYNDLIGVLQSGLMISQRAVQIARERAATAEDTADALQAVTAAEGEQVQAQQAVTSAIQSQIDRLRQLQEVQVGILDAGQSVVDLFNETQALSGRQQSASAQFQQQREVVAALDAQLQGQVRVLEQQRANEASYQDQLETVRQIAELQKQLDAAPTVKLDGPVGLTQAQRDSIAELGRDALSSYPEQARTAAESFALIETQVDDLEGALGRAQEAVTRFTDQVGSSEALNLKIKVDDAEARKALTTAKRALEEVFGPDGAGRIVNQAGEAGQKAGKGLIDAFADGILQNEDRLGSVLRSVLQRQVRDYLTGSNAKKGPLSDVIQSGGGLVRGYTGGMRREFGTARSASREFASIMRPAISAVAIPTSRPASYPATASPDAAGSPLIGILNVNGTPSAPTSVFEMSASQFYREAERVAQRELRKAGK